MRCGRCDEHFFMLMHACHECGEPWAIWLCGVILPLLFLAGCVGFLWFESGHQTRCPIESIGPQPHCLRAHGLRSAARIAAAVRRSVCRLMPTGSMRRARDSFDVRYSQYCLCIL